MSSTTQTRDKASAGSDGTGVCVTRYSLHGMMEKEAGTVQLKLLWKEWERR